MAVVLGVFAVLGLSGSADARREAACTLVSSVVVVDLNNQKHSHVIDHALDARRDGHPRILHIRRGEARANRSVSLRGWPTVHGYDRDEYPPAMCDEGGLGASVRYVNSSENRSAGQLMGRLLAPYCNGQRFAYER